MIKSVKSGAWRSWIEKRGSMIPAAGADSVIVLSTERKWRYKSRIFMRWYTNFLNPYLQTFICSNNSQWKSYREEDGIKSTLIHNWEISKKITDTLKDLVQLSLPRLAIIAWKDSSSFPSRLQNIFIASLLALVFVTVMLHIPGGYCCWAEM